MRLLPGQPVDAIGSITSYSLTRSAVVDADILPRVYQPFNDEMYSPLSAILAEKGYFTEGLKDGAGWTNKFRTVSSNHIMYRIASSQKRKIHLSSNDTGVTFYSGPYPTKPGFKGTAFYIYTDNNWARPKEVIELNDNKTQLYIYDEEEPVQFNGVYRYEVKLNTNDPDDYCDPNLLTEGSEAAAVMTMYEQDFSETGSEKYTFDGWGHSYLSLQRVKMSWSGTAAAMKPNKDWYAYQNKHGQTSYGYLEHAEKEMLRKAVRYHEYQLLFGKSTVDARGEVFLHDKKGREIMAGGGLLFGNDGAVENPMTTAGWTKQYIDSRLEDIELRAGKEGYIEVVAIMGMKAMNSFRDLMFKSGFKTMDNNVEGRGNDKGVNMNYQYYEYGNVRLIPRYYRYFDSEDRPTKTLSNGDKKGSWDCILCPIGINSEGDNLIELVQLRPAVTGTINGIDSGAAEIASSVDGSSKHHLWQTGIVSRTTVQYCFMPWSA